MASQEIKVPDIGDFTDVPIIEILVNPGDTVAAEDPLLTLESDKATLDVPSPVAGTTSSNSRSRSATRVSEGTVIGTVEAAGGGGEQPKERLTSQAADTAGGGSPETATGPREELTAPAGYGSSAGPPTHQSNGTAPAGAPAPYTGTKGDVHAEVLVLGAGPGGYTAAFRAADLGKKVVMVDSRGPLGGVCLNVGCIPSKALLHAAKVIAETKEMAAHGISFSSPNIDLDALRTWKDGVVGKLTGGLTGLAKQRKVQTVVGTGTFTSPNMVSVAGPDGSTTTVSFDSAIIAAGSEPVKLPFIPHDDPRVIDSTGALDLDGIPERLLVLGGGIIGLEMATVYSELGSKISVVELMDQLIPGADKDLVTPLTKRIAKGYEAIWLGTKVTNVEAGPDGLTVSFDASASKDKAKAPETAVFDKILVAVGRRPNGRVDRGRGRRGVRRRARVRAGRQAAAHQRRPHLRHRRRGRAADARPQGDPRGQGRRGEHGRAQQLLRRHRHPVGGLHRPRGRVGRGHRERGQGRRGQVRQGRVPLGRLRPVAVARAGTRASPRSSSTRPTTGSSVPGSSAPARVTSSPRPRWRSRSAPTPPTSASPSTPTRRCRRPSACPPRPSRARSPTCTCPRRRSDPRAGRSTRREIADRGGCSCQVR